MAMTATLVKPVTTDDFLYALWGIRPGLSARAPRVHTVPAMCHLDDEVGQWLHRLWGI